MVRNKYKNVRQMLRVIYEAGANYSLARQIYRDIIRNNGRPLTSREILDRRNFQRIDQQFSNEESVLRHISTH